MKKYDDFDEKPIRAKRPKHSKNRPGEGMRYINSHVELDIYDDIDVDDDDLYNYDTTVDNDRKPQTNYERNRK